jgi:hypothetical protein
MKRYRAGELVGAAEQFHVAIDADPRYIVSHYNLACVASLLGDAKTAVAELRWLDEPSDSQRWTKLAKAAADPDLDFVSPVPAVRQLLGLGPFDATAALSWLSERHGVWSWSAQGDCKQRTYTMRFSTDGLVSLDVEEECDGKAPAHDSFSGHARMGPSGVTVDIEQWKQWPGAVPLTFSTCPTLQAPGSCFMLSSGKSTLGPFHRGRAAAPTKLHILEDF